MKKRQIRTRQKVEVRIPFPKLLANILVLVAVVGVSYVGLCARCDRLGREIKALENDCREARQRVINEQDRWSNLLAPANFERALKRHHLEMTLPDDRRIVRVRKGEALPRAMTLAYRQ